MQEIGPFAFIVLVLLMFVVSDSIQIRFEEWIKSMALCQEYIGRATV